MKRPQSAKQARHYWAQPSNEDSHVDQYSRPFLKNNKKMLKASTSNDLSRLLPKRIPHEKERLYYETLQLKTSLNDITEENVRLKTKVAILEREKERMGKAEDVGLWRGGRSGLVGQGWEKENTAVHNMKRLVRESKEETQMAKAEVQRLKKTVRYTKFNELEIERQAIFDQNKKQAKLIIQLQGELEERMRQEHQLQSMSNQLKTRNEELRDVAEDNARYEEALEEMEIRNKELAQKVAAIQRKMQKDLAAERRRVEQLTKANQILKNSNRVFEQQLQEEKKKNKKLARPVSSHPYSHGSSNQASNIKGQGTRDRQKEANPAQKQQALQLNDKLKKQLEEAKKKLAISENMLRVGEPDDSGFKTGEEPFELDLTKNDGQTFIQAKPREQRKPVGSKRQEKVQEKREHKVESRGGGNISPEKLKQLRQVLTYRMKYNRYTFEQLKGDIEASPVHTFTVEDLVPMLSQQPFYLGQQFIGQFLKLAMGNNYGQATQISSSTLIATLRKLIQDFSLIDEQEEEQMLYKIADFMTQNRASLEKEFQGLRNPKQFVKKAQLQKILQKRGGLTPEEIDLTICYVSINSESLQKINYVDLLDKFMMNNSKEIEERGVEEVAAEEELSLGENEDVPDHFLDEEDQII